MNLQPIENILRHQLAPWRPENKIMDKFKVKLQELPDKSYKSIYEVEYLPPTNDKLKYYLRTIKNTVYDYLEDFYKVVAETKNEDHRDYLLNKTLNSIYQYFKDTQEVIEQRDYNFNEINTSNNNVIRDEIYIVYLIKNYLIWLYLEIKELLHEQIDYDFYDEEIIQAEFFYTYTYKSFLHKLPEQIYTGIKVSPIKVPNKIKFVPQPFDFRDTSPDIIPYEEIVINAERFSDFEIKLYENKYIDENYFFIKDRKTNNSENFELIALAIIEKGLLRKSRLGKLIKDVEYRKFLNHRYKSNIDKKFRNFRNNKAKITDFIETNIWLRNIPKY